MEMMKATLTEAHLTPFRIPAKTSKEKQVLLWANWQLRDGISAFYANQRALTRERRVEMAVARVIRGIYTGWRRVMEELDRQEVILQEKRDAVSMENLVKLRMFRESIETGPIIRKQQEAA